MLNSPRTQATACLVWSLALAAFSMPSRAFAAGSGEPHRSPVALALSTDGGRLLTANQTAGTVALIDTASRNVLAEVATGDRPAGIALTRDGRRAVVTHWFGYDVALLEVGPDSLKVVGRVEVGPEPRGVAIAPDGRTAYVAVGAANEIVKVNLDEMKVIDHLAVDREPWGLTITPDGALLAVGNARAGTISVVDLSTWKLKQSLPMDGLCLRQMAVGPDGMAYVANLKNRGFPTTPINIDLGWVLGQRVTRVALDGTEGYETLSLDPRGKAVGDAHGLGFSSNGRFMAVSAGGTRELLIFRLDLSPIPWRSNSSRDLIPPDLVNDNERFRRVPLDGRPTEIAFAPDNQTVYVANYLLDAVQVVNAETASIEATIPLGGPKDLSLARQGEWLFHDASRSLNQWYSCNTCHSDGHTNGSDFDTLNDGWQDLSTTHQRSRKKVPTMRRVTETGPWTWHGWQHGLDDAMVESFTKSMQGNRPRPDEIKAIVAYLGTLDYPRNPYRKPDGTLTDSAIRGEAVFKSSKAACNTCHGGPEFTDGKVHDLGLGESRDVYKGHNPPSLRGTYDKAPYLHDGRAATLRDLLTQDHSPELVTGLGALEQGELADLIAYLQSL